MPHQLSEADQRAIRQIQALGGTVRTGQAVSAGIHPRTLYRLRDLGHLEPLSRGLYRLADAAQPSLPDLLVVAARLPKAVLCLTSALSFHELTEEVPHEVHIALPRGAEQPRIEHPPLRVVRMSAPCLDAGVGLHDVDGAALRVYEPAKTVVDCFKFRSRVGVETALAGLKRLRRRRDFDVERLLDFARTCRVERVIRPYVEALL
ncbi:MAG: type IV toxin-antitoxin system AbiEi family antitoxin domain-containing protein [Planctomycetes bacterium]|nr:type IV toxin-antitoxin system AbiEi family antitoxin domain-containing protein [Planctomycetota bacterium]